MKNILCKIVVLAGILVLGNYALAATHYTTGNPLDTPTGTKVTAEAADNSVGYSDADTNLMPTVEVEGGDITADVTSEYGFSMLRTVADQTVTPGQIVTHETYSATNEGNADDTYYVGSLFNHFNGAQNWTVEVVNDDTSTIVATLTAGSVTSNAFSVDDNDDLDFYYLVTVPSAVGDAPDGASIEVVTTVETTSSPSGEYTGGNALTYGGSHEVDGTFIDKVAAPILVLTRVATIDAPKDYSDDHWDPVPGAIITFTMTLTNEGGASAESVVLIDKIPDNTKLACINTSGNTTNVNITNGQYGNDTGWTISYTTEASPPTDMDYGAPWTVIGTLNASTDDFPGNGLTWTTTSPEYSATYVKWEKLYVDSGDSNKTLSWGVTIR